MTFSTKDAVVLGCDSLATTTRQLVNPLALWEYFDEEDGYSLRRGPDGEPVLKDFRQIFDLAQSVPYDHMTDLDKLVSLEPLPMGFMYTGITSIGDRTIKSLVSEFKEKDKAFRTQPSVTNFTVKSIAKRLLDHLAAYYDEGFRDHGEYARPGLEFLLAGYDKNEPLPKVMRVNVGSKDQESCSGFGVVFGGMMEEIQRIVHGVDLPGRIELEMRCRWLLTKYQERVRAIHGPEVELPDVDEFRKQGYRLFGQVDPEDEESPEFVLPALRANWGDFSEQNAIDCVAYFIGIMREAHRFSSKMPTVGGPIHIGLVSKADGFRFLSREEYRHEDHRVQRVQPNAFRR